MDCRELFIGGYYDYDGDIIKMDSSKLSYILEIGGEYEYNPIHLTEEWLLKFGLNSQNLENGYYDGTCIGHYPKSDGWYFVVDSYDDGYGGLNYTTKEIKYVHELQNLYFFWNDKELEIK